MLRPLREEVALERTAALSPPTAEDKVALDPGRAQGGEDPRGHAGIPIPGWDWRQEEKPAQGQAWGPEGRRKRQGADASQEMSAGWHQAFSN